MGPDGQLVVNSGAAATGGTGISGPKKAASAALQKEDLEKQTAHTNASEALSILDQMKPLFGKAQTSAATNIGQAGKSFFTGKTAPEQDSLKDLGILASNLSKFADRKMFGPQFTEADVKMIRESVGDLGRATSVSEREVIEQRLRGIFERQLNRGNAASTSGGAPVNIAGDDDFDKLAPGTRFVGPDGVPRIKP
jgi:hypothetical protein